jgi:hypothetical protein
MAVLEVASDWEMGIASFWRRTKGTAFASFQILKVADGAERAAP